jgi:hypothetical protein
LTAELGEESSRIVHEAIATAEASAKDASLDNNTVDETARSAARTAEVVSYGSAHTSMVDPALANATRAALAAAETVRAAQAAARAIGVGALDAAASAAALAAQVAEATDDAATAAAGAAAIDAARADLSRLLGLNLGGQGGLGQPIDPSASGRLGPLWPKGALDWCPNATC